MPRGLSFSDAVSILGGRDRLVAGLDRLTGGLLIAGSASGSAFVLSLFDPMSEFARFSGDLVATGLDRIRGLSRFDRSQRLAAAHAVIVVSAYFEAVGSAPLPFCLYEVDLSVADEVALVGGGPAGRRLASVVDGLLRAGVPMPTPEVPVEESNAAVLAYYRALASDLVRWLSGLHIWDRLDETQREQLEAVLRHEVPSDAMERYEDAFHRLAIEVPEVAYWSNRLDHRATRTAVERAALGLGRLELILRNIASGQQPDRRRDALAQFYRSSLTRPILSSGEVPSGIRIPALGEAYVSPDFRAGEVSASEDLVSETWWAAKPLRSDLEEFLVGYLNGVRATQAPLIVLGQPGSGKSVLTRVLAARLPPEDYLVIRVVLREVHADADLQTHIEYAIRVTTGESVSWPDLAHSQGDALPVVMLDGFDELLQATGTSQSDYLERVADFQQREAVFGRPVAVVVTSRTAVADRARCSPGTIAIRLEPFQRPQIERWLECWNTANATCFAERGLRELQAEALLAHPELSSQPLLLMMLALYDADRNALQGLGGNLGRAELYERLLHRFAEREVAKVGRSMSDRDYIQAVDHELLRLSVVAFAMFNRRRQWVSEEELDDDLPTLLPASPTRGEQHVGLRAELTPSEQAVGRFFFVHQSSATRDGRQLRTFEFLHATFGEYLIGRLVAHELSDMAKVARLNRDRSRRVAAGDAFLHAVLSFAPLTMRGTAVSFLRELLSQWSDDERQLLRDPLLRLLQRVMEPVQDRSYEQYQPMSLGVPTRHAIYLFGPQRQRPPRYVTSVRSWPVLERFITATLPASVQRLA